MSHEKKVFQWKNLKETFQKVKMPVLRLRYRLVLYSFTIVFIVLSLIQAACEKFDDMAGIAFYTLAAFTLAASCYYLVLDIRYGAREKIRQEIAENPFASRMAGDYRYRTLMFAVPGLTLNMIFAIFNGAIGIYSSSPWYGTLSAYYILLSVMRFTVVRHGKCNKYDRYDEHSICDEYDRDDGYDRKISDSECLRDLAEKWLADEISIYRRCGMMFVIMTAALCGTVILILNEEGGKRYPGFVIYAVAAYTFYKIIMSIINLVKVRKFRSPLLMAIRDIGYVDACVSILSLQTAMFASFGNGQEDLIKRMNGMTGFGVCLMVLGTGVHSICLAKKMKRNV